MVKQCTVLHLTPHARSDLPVNFHYSFPFVVNERETVSSGEQLGHEREREKEENHHKKRKLRAFCQDLRLVKAPLPREAPLLCYR